MLSRIRLLLLGTLLVSASSLAAAERPNILFILTDDQAPWALGYSGYAQAVTPNLNRLFASGAYFPNAFTTTPVCSPSRAGLMTSRYGTELGITDWINPRNEPELGLDPDVVTWPKLLKEAGYRTGLVGKWHLGTEDKYHPRVFGYDTFVGFRAGGSTPKDPVLEVRGELDQKHEGLLTDILTDYAIEFIESPDETPFLLSLHYRAPHAPWLPVADKDWAPFADLDPEIPNPGFPNLDTPRVKKFTREYLASVAGVDRNILRLLKALESSFAAENTIVIFTSDHGYNMGHNGMWHKGNGHWILTQLPEGTENIPALQRPNMYDNSLRVPLAIRWPGVIAPKTVINETVTILDWFPTLLDMAGVPLPPDLKIHGRSIVPLIKGTANNWDNTLYAEYSTHHQSKTAMRMYRTPRWKLKKDFLNPGRDELYNLELDPEERDNIIDSPSAEVRNIHHELNEKILATMQKLDDPALK
ncbi:MAG: sulfatase-like hydrolase/transferase [Planctomycetota bacterium]|nr:sulfatase-like hydrolase/transferase [Planctomycetota bacterium]MDA1212671.1 sulfatase-like hydrolase/transferase [Planctomycetota bacterium]